MDVAIDWITGFGAGTWALITAVLGALPEISLMALGAVVFILFGALRAIRDDDWDSSNILNAFRAIAQHVLRLSRSAKFFYLSGEQVRILENAGLPPKRAFPYLKGDEFGDHFTDTAPEDDSV